MKKIYMIAGVILIVSSVWAYSILPIMSGEPCPTAPFTDNISGNDGDGLTSCYWRPLATLGGSYFTGSFAINSSNLVCNGSTSGGAYVGMYASAVSLSTQANRYFSITTSGYLPTGGESTPIARIFIWNAENDSDVSSLSAYKNCIYLNVLYQSATQALVQLNSRDSAGNNTILNNGLSVTCTETGNDTWKVELVDSTHVRVLHNGSEIISSQAVTCNFGSSIYAGLAVVHMNPTTLTTITFTSASFQ